MEPQNEITIDGKVFGRAESPALIYGNKKVVFDEIVINGNLSSMYHGEIEYDGLVMKVVSINSVIGLLVDEHGSRGPVWRDVHCEIVGRQE